ncbi:MAG: hypothetical protein V4760_13275 [Bdellovibrionota bacterium]
MQQSAQPQQNPELVLKILWGALAMAQFMLVFVSSTILTTPPDPAAFTDIVKYMFLAMAAGALVMAFVLPNFLSMQIRTRIEKEGRSIDSMEVRELAPRATVPFIMRLALLESVTLMGMMLTLQSGDQSYVMALAAVALVGFAVSFPSERNIRGILR